MDMHVAALALGAAAGFGLALVLTQVGLRHLEPMRGASISVPSATLLFLALAPWLFDTAGFRGASALMFAFTGCLFPAAVTLLTFEANRRVGPAITSALGNLSPLFAIFIALLVLGEVPRWGQLVGMGVILAGVLLIMGAPRTIPHHAFGWAIALLLLAAFHPRPGAACGQARPRKLAEPLLGHAHRLPDVRPGSARLRHRQGR